MIHYHVCMFNMMSVHKVRSLTSGPRRTGSNNESSTINDSRCLITVCVDCKRWLRLTFDGGNFVASKPHIILAPIFIVIFLAFHRTFTFSMGLQFLLEHDMEIACWWNKAWWGFISAKFNTIGDFFGWFTVNNSHRTTLTYARCLKIGIRTVSVLKALISFANV